MAVELALSEVAQGVFELRLPIPFEDGLVNVFLFTDGNDVDLLDCGMNAEESLDAIHRALQQLGTPRIRRLVVTHIHPDHYGLAGRVREGSGAWVGLHPADAALIYERYDAPDDLLDRVGAMLRRMGAPPLRRMTLATW